MGPRPIECQGDGAADSKAGEGNCADDTKPETAVALVHDPSALERRAIMAGAGDGQDVSGDETVLFC